MDDNALVELVNMILCSDTERNNRNARNYMQIKKEKWKKREREREMKESISNVFALKYIKMDYSLFHVHMLRSAEWIIKSVFRIKKINGNERLPFAY